uniref:Uncharacterized protein n=2 Tax=Caenorhabditis japonica TaxID=281687 RepID=A0A8R1IGV7_CAEJA
MEERDLLVNAPGKHKKNAIKEDANISSANTNENLKSDRSTSPSSEMRSLAFQLASANNEHRKLRIQAENRDEDCRRLEATLEEKAKRVLFLENERIRLLEKERQAKQLGDDLQAAHYRIEKLRSLEGFEKKYKEASEALEYLMSKYEAVTEKYNAQEDWASELEKNLKSLRLENKDQCVIEDNLFRLKKTVSDLEAEMVRKNMEIEVCHDEKYRLTQELKEREERICQLEMTTTSISPQYMDSLANQLEHAKIDEFDIMKAQVRKLRAKTEEAIIDTSELTLQESDELKEQLSAEKLRNSELLSNYQKLQKEQEKIEGISKRVEIELEETILRSEKMQTERDSAINYLHYVRKILSQFKEEYGKQVEDESENDDRIYQFEVISLNEKIGESCQHAPEQLLMQANQNNKQVASRIDEGKTNNNLMKNSKKCVKKSYFEAKNCILKSEIDNFEDAIEGLKLQLSISKATHKRVNEKDDIIKNLHDKLGILENQLEVTQQQLDVELKKIERLRENLVFEKSMKTDLAGRLKSLCTKLAVNGGNFDVDELDDEQLIKKIDDIMMSALVTVKRESDTLRIQQTKQIAELLDLKKDIENLRYTWRDVESVLQL